MHVFKVFFTIFFTKRAGFVFSQFIGWKKITRITNGLIEKFWQYRKRKIINELPARYISQTIKLAVGQANIFIDSFKKNEPNFKDGQSNADDDIDDVYGHHSAWAKNNNDQKKLKKVIKEREQKKRRIEKDKENQGFYQKPTKNFQNTIFNDVPVDDFNDVPVIDFSDVPIKFDTLVYDHVVDDYKFDSLISDHNFSDKVDLIVPDHFDVGKLLTGDVIQDYMNKI